MSIMKQWGLIALAIASGAALRIAGLWNDFWLDEIWALNTARQASNLPELFTEVLRDNNHLLQSMYMLGVDELRGASSHWASYRLLSLICGIALLPVCLFAGGQWSKQQGTFFALLTSFSFLLILYSTEARGYAAMLLAGSLCIWLSARYHYDEERWGSACGYWFAAAVGLLAHVSLAILLVGLGVWSLCVFTKRHGLLTGIIPTVFLHALPAFFCVALYLSFVRYLPPGTGPLYPFAQIVIDTLSLTVGGPEIFDSNIPRSALAFGVALIVALLTLFEIARLWRARQPVWCLYATTLIICPIVFTVVGEPRVLFVRYYLAAILTWYLLAAGFLSWLWSRGTRGRALATVLVASFLAGNGFYTTLFLEHGRGIYRAGISYMVEHHSDNPIRIAGDYDFRHRTVLTFYRQYVPGGDTLQYVDGGLSAEPLPEWYITHKQDRYYEPKQKLLSPDGTTYELVKTFPYATQSGWAWYLYQRKGSGGAVRSPTKE